MINDRYKYDLNILEENKCSIISGTDEVGRGAMAGPIVVASVILNKDYYHPDINDSKKISAKKREELFELIIKNSVSYSIKVYDADIVDKLNPKATSILGMIESLQGLKIIPDICLIDGEKVLLDKFKTKQVIKGDSFSQVIGAASILAKVYRDRIMIDFSKEYKNYAFEEHKGYCTKKHIELTKSFGVLDIHRKTYKPIKLIIKGE